MIALDCFVKLEDGSLQLYQLYSFDKNSSWQVVQEGELLATLQKEEGNWSQRNSSGVGWDVFRKITNYIDQQQFNVLPAEICARWPKLVANVVLQTDTAYMVVCKEGVSFDSFRRIFAKYVAGLLKDEWQVIFNVYNHDFTDDFTVTADAIYTKKYFLNKAW